MAEIKVCPKCGSKNISPDFDIASIFTNPSNHVCGDCGFRGLAVEIDERDIEKFKNSK